MRLRSTFGPVGEVRSVTVIQMWRITPGPSTSISVTESPALIVWMQGLPLRDGPSALAAVAAVPLPPVGFSALTQRVRPWSVAIASESRAPLPKPEVAIVFIVLSFVKQLGKRGNGCAAYHCRLS